MTKKLSDVISIDRQFLRSIRLTDDFGKAEAIKGFILQPSAKSLLDVTAKHLVNTQQRAFTWTGPYGGGKSSLALALAAYVGGKNEAQEIAKSALNIHHDDDIYAFFKSDRPWTVLPIVGRRTSIVEELGSAIDTYLYKQAKSKKQSKKRNVIQELTQTLNSRDDIEGILLIIDELGKFLEYATQENDDIGFYQELAEAASRSKKKLVVIGILHQSFEQYAARLGKTLQQEWAKVQGRYIDIPIMAGTDEVISLIGRAIQADFAHPESLNIVKKVSKVIKKRRPSAVSNISEQLDACWPLHPVTAALLGPASKKRFGQNERSVFSFLASAEPLGFSEVVKGLDLSGTNYYWPHQFWDYLQINFEPAILASPDAHRYAACVEAIERTEAKFTDLHVSLVKTVGLLELLRNGSGLAAEKELLSLCVEHYSKKFIEASLNDLTSASILIFRKHLDAYGIYAGSDFDIDLALRNATAHLGQPDLTKISEMANLGPITARRHYWETGAMRWLSRVMLYDTQISSRIKDFELSGSQCGEFILLLSDQQKDTHNLQEIAKKYSIDSAKQGLVIGTPQNIDKIYDLANDISALDFVKTNSKELDGDNIARRELNSRLEYLSALLTDHLRDAFQNASWYFNGESCNKTLSHISSNVADHIYNKTPYVISELVNRNALSSNAKQAQRELLHKMLAFSNEQHLGYKSFSASSGVYHTVIRALGLHHYDERKDEWYFSNPQGTDRSNTIVSLWDATKNLFFNSSEIINLSKLYKLWQEPPFGVKNGLLPILALSFFLAYRDNFALYIDGSYTPDVADAHIDEWLQDPKRIDLRYVQLDATNKKLLADLSKTLSAHLNINVNADVLDSARGLVSLVYQLPYWTRKTDLLSDETKKIRRLLLNASDPYKVLFEDLPFIFKAKSSQDIIKKINIVTNELTNAFYIRLNKIKTKLINALDISNDIKNLKVRSKTVEEVSPDFLLKTFAMRLGEYTGELTDIEGLLMLAIGKPSKSWTDRDIEAGEIQLHIWAMEFRKMEALAEIRGLPNTRQAIGVIFGAEKTVMGTFDISVQDTEKVEKIANELMQKITTEKTKREILLAAIAQVGAQLFETK